MGGRLASSGVLAGLDWSPALKQSQAHERMNMFFSRRTRDGVERKTAEVRWKQGGYSGSK
jgi:hypothetical protein